MVPSPTTVPSTTTVQSTTMVPSPTTVASTTPVRSTTTVTSPATVPSTTPVPSTTTVTSTTTPAVPCTMHLMPAFPTVALSITQTPSKMTPLYSIFAKCTTVALSGAAAPS